MKKIGVLCSLILLVSFSRAQVIKPLSKGKLVGFSLTNELGNGLSNDNNTLIREIAPQYEEVMAYVSNSIGNLNLGNAYVSVQMMIDTEYIEVPIDPDDLSRVKIDTFVQVGRPLILGKPLLIKQNGKWGMIDWNGKELLAPVYNQFLPLIRSNWLGLNETDMPLILMQKENNWSLKTAQLQSIISEGDFPAYFQTCRDKADAIDLMLFGDYLLVCNGGGLRDSLVKVPAKKQSVKGKVKIVEPAYSYSVTRYSGGTFNALNLKTHTWLWPADFKNVLIHFLDADGKNLCDDFDPRSESSFDKYTENNRLGIRPARVELEGRP